MAQVRKLRTLTHIFPNITSGSEASEAAIKLVTQYFQQEMSPPSYHGATLGALDLSDFKIRKKIYRTILKDNMHTVPACHPFRNGSGMSEAEYVEWHKKKLIQKVKELGPERVAAFIVEPVVGAVSA
jgi:adenosylmethionine-8-amino-7-oxononanoate aminotransferase